ncbi:hypothetical protein MSPP1_002651 [Malassezia sp. CBS 17886]|nr:hypothetical protein MSPP1_002651 [Malassezia sp. CBS 17886]
MPPKQPDRGSADGAPSKGYDADAPYLIESYQHASLPAQPGSMPPAYTYSNNPHGPAPTPHGHRSWDDAARAKANPMPPPMPGGSRHVYVDVDAADPELGLGGTPAAAPAPLNATITGYATTLGWDLGKLCALVYALPPFSSVLILLWETQNDLVRFHAYQSGFCGAGVILVTWMLSLLGLSWIPWLFLLGDLAGA